MQTKNLLLLAALTTGATLGSLALAPSAEAILYNINTTFSGTDNGDDGLPPSDVPINGTIIGSFEYTPGGPNNGYSNFNITVTGTGGTPSINRYDVTYSTLTPFASQANGFDLRNGLPSGSIGFRQLFVFFTSTPTGTPGEILTLSTSSPFSSVQRGTGATNNSINFGGTAQAVPLESDALPIVGAAAFMAGGLWWKRRRAQAKTNLNFLTANQEKSA